MMDIKEKVKVRTNHFSDYHLHPEVSFQNIHSTFFPMINSEEICTRTRVITLNPNVKCQDADPQISRMQLRKYRDLCAELFTHRTQINPNKNSM